eukprot:2854887-Prymnesium_polylepis.1
MSLAGGLATPLDRATAFEHLQALIANGPDLDDLDEWDDILTRTAAFCKSSSLLTEVEKFCKEHAGGFEVVEEGEYPLYFTQLHEEYAARVEELLEGFLRSQGCSTKQFYETCRACLERSRSENRWNQDAMFVQVVARPGAPRVARGCSVSCRHPSAQPRCPGQCARVLRIPRRQVLTASTEFEEFVGLMRVAAKFLRLPNDDKDGEAAELD